jgi:hypothetical protein
LSCTATGTTHPASFLGPVFAIFTGTDPFVMDQVACSAAIDQTRAMGLDPADPNNAEVLQTNYEMAVLQAQADVKGTPVSNPVQRSVDIAVGTATPSTPIVQTKPPVVPANNFALLIGFLVIMAIGFVFVIR